MSELILGQTLSPGLPARSGAVARQRNEAPREELLENVLVGGWIQAVSGDRPCRFRVT